MLFIYLGTLKDQKREVIIRSFTEEKNTIISYKAPQRNCTQPYTVLLISSEGCAHHALHMEKLRSRQVQIASCFTSFGCYPLNTQKVDWENKRVPAE